MTKMRMTLPTEDPMSIYEAEEERQDVVKECADAIFIVLLVANFLVSLLSLVSVENAWGVVVIHALISVFMGIGFSKMVKSSVPYYYYNIVGTGLALGIAGMGAYVASTV